MESPNVMPWFVRGDIDGFFGLALDNLVQLLLIDALCRGVAHFACTPGNAAGARKKRAIRTVRRLRAACT